MKNLTQEEAQRGTTEHFQRTVNELPLGTSFDVLTTDTPGSNVPCGEWTDSTQQLLLFEDIRWVTLAPGFDNSALESALERIWTAAGWEVIKNDPRIVTPNLVAITADGYRLLMRYNGPKNDEPSVTVSSPCFPRNAARYDIPVPTSITRR